MPGRLLDPNLSIAFCGISSNDSGSRIAFTEARQCIYYYYHAADDDDDAIRVVVPSFRLIANKPVGSSKFHFLSDHFGIAAEIKI
jgi:hypothetical protein